MTAAYHIIDTIFATILEQQLVGKILGRIHLITINETYLMLVVEVKNFRLNRLNFFQLISLSPLKTYNNQGRMID